MQKQSKKVFSRFLANVGAKLTYWLIYNLLRRGNIFNAYLTEIHKSTRKHIEKAKNKSFRENHDETGYDNKP